VERDFLPLQRHDAGASGAAFPRWSVGAINQQSNPASFTREFVRAALVEAQRFDKRSVNGIHSVPD